MIKVAGHKVLIKHMQFEERMEEILPDALKQHGFIIEATADQKKREEVASEVGTVVGLGKTCWHAYDKFLKNGDVNPEWEPWCKVGDQIIFARYAGKIVEDPVSKEKFMIINDEDVHGVVSGFKSPFEE
jgi:co-chaperonin GroES (HSP10)